MAECIPRRVSANLNGRDRCFYFCKPFSKKGLQSNHGVNCSRRTLRPPPLHQTDVARMEFGRPNEQNQQLSHSSAGQAMRDPLSSRADSPAVHLAAAGTSGASLQIPSTDGILFALLTLGHEIFLHKRVQAAGQPGLFEILVLALGVGLSLGGLAWWTTPGTQYSMYRKHLIFAIRLHHQLAVFVIPCSAAFTFNTVPWADYAYALVPPGWIPATLLFHIFMPLPLLPSMLLHATSLLMIPPKSCQCCALQFMDRLEGLVAATVRRLLRPMLMRPLRGRLSALSVPGKCQVVLWTFYFLGATGIPVCMAVETWTTRMQRPLASSMAHRGLRRMQPQTVTRGYLQAAQAVWVRSFSAVRLLAYLAAMQCSAAVVMALYALMGGDQETGSPGTLWC